MSNFKIKGTISKIGEVKQLDNGASVLDYIVDNTSDNGYVTQYNFGMYKKPEYAEHIENFSKFNKVGDVVEVEFTIRGQEYKGKIYNSLNHWKCEKVENTALSPELTATSPEDDLPF